MSRGRPRALLAAIEGEFRRYDELARAALNQLDDTQLAVRDSPHENSVAILVQHIAGNLVSRFTNFLTADGEKSWRQRDTEFEPLLVERRALLARWTEGWSVLSKTLGGLDDGHLMHRVTIRGQELTVAQALQRSLAHISYHVGQIVQMARRLRGEAWVSLSIPTGRSDAYARDPNRERPPGPRDHRS
jgi:uncharacterized damage-inducible protein DinB